MLNKQRDLRHGDAVSDGMEVKMMHEIQRFLFVPIDHYEDTRNKGFIDSLITKNIKHNRKREKTSQVLSY